MLYFMYGFAVTSVCILYVSIKSTYFVYVSYVLDRIALWLIYLTIALWL